MKKQAILIALIILSSLSISAKDIVVINSENGKPLVGAKAFTENDSLISNRYGELSNSEITSVDFVTYNNIHLNSTLQNDTLVVDFPFTLESPKKLGRIEGKVTNDLNEELSQKRIELTKDGFKYSIRSNSSGNYSFDYLSAGNWDITVHKSKDYDSYDSEVELNSNENQVLNHKILLKNRPPQPGALTGKVVDTNGLPVSGVKISINDSTRIVKVKESGNYTLDNLKEGKYKLNVNFKNFNHETDYIFVEGGIKKTINFELDFERDTILISNGIELMMFSDVSDDFDLEPEPDQFIFVQKSTSGRSMANPLAPVKRKSASTSSSNNETIEAGQLTSGEVNDFRKWEMWADIAENKLNRYIDEWGIEPTNRYTVQLTSIDNRPVIDARVNLINQIGKVIWSARSDNTGKAELWADAYKEIDDDTSGLAVEVFYKGKRKFERNISAFKDGINFIQIDEYCSQPNKVDILFAMDATGSMGDEIEYLKTELLDIIDRLEQSNNDIDLRIGSLFYRDYDYPFSELLNTHDLTDDISSVNEFINSEKAISGNSTPEAVDVALSSAVNEFTWSEDAIARIMFLILDAPPHSDAVTMRRFKELTAKAAEMGIRIIPLVASGINKSDEYLMRSVALLTNGTYLFLTDDSGIGNSHIKPTTDSYDVEMMNEMIVRIINQFIDVPKCGSDQLEYANKIEDKIYNKQETINQNISEYIKIYPNPTDGPLTLSLQEEYDNLFVVDMNGKILFKVEAAQGEIQVNLSSFPSGAYFLKYSKDGAWGSTQLQLIR